MAFLPALYTFIVYPTYRLEASSRRVQQKLGKSTYTACAAILVSCIHYKVSE